MTDQLAKLVTQIRHCLINPGTLPHRKTFVDFWYEIAAIMTSDVNAIGDPYLRHSAIILFMKLKRIYLTYKLTLKNTCREIEKIAASSLTKYR